jgi:hypothetical protein
VKCDKNFFSLEREITFVVISDKGVVVLFVAGMELHSCCQACLFILAVEVHFFTGSGGICKAGKAFGCGGQCTPPCP